MTFVQDIRKGIYKNKDNNNNITCIISFTASVTIDLSYAR
jgi:hypothetical protein